MASRKRLVPTRWLLFLALGTMFVWQLVRQREGSGTASAPAAFDETEADRTISASVPPDEPHARQTPAAGETPPAPAETAAPAETPAPEGLTRAEAGRILGCGPEEAAQFLNGGPVTRESVERLAVEHYRWRRHVADPESYWVTLKQASSILGVSTQRLKQLLDRGEVPYVVHRDGVRLMRREELDAAAHAAGEKR